MNNVWTSSDRCWCAAHGLLWLVVIITLTHCTLTTRRAHFYVSEAEISTGVTFSYYSSEQFCQTFGTSDMLNLHRYSYLLKHIKVGLWHFLAIRLQVQHRLPWPLVSLHSDWQMHWLTALEQWQKGWFILISWASYNKGSNTNKIWI